MARGFPSMTALLGLLAIAGYQNRDKIAEMLKEFSGPRTGKPGEGPAASLPGGLRDLLAGTSAGGLLSGGLGELLKRFQQSGQQETVDSWVRQGDNRDIAPPDLKKALGADVLQELTRATGLSEQELLARLSRELPSAVDRYTPDGKIAAA